jgi:DNA-binding transcriptional ArsR family regulator
MTNHRGAARSALLGPLLGSSLKEWLLLFLLTRGDAYPRELAQELGFALLAVQKQLAVLEDGGVVYSRMRGRTRLYSLNPRYPFRRELEALLRRALEALPAGERERLYTPRLRPRRPGKPLTR